MQYPYISMYSRSKPASTHSTALDATVGERRRKQKFSDLRTSPGPLWRLHTWFDLFRYRLVAQRWDMLAFPWINNLSTMLVTSLPVLFSFLLSRSGIPVIKSQSVWPDDDGYRNTERAQRYLSIVGGANPNLELSSYLTYFSMNP